MERAQELYSKEVNKFFEIEAVIGRYEKRADQVVLKSESEESDMASKIKDLREEIVGNSAEWSLKKLNSKMLKLYYVHEIYDEMGRHSQCMFNKWNKLLLMLYNSEADLIKEYAANDNFTWQHFLEKEGLCIDISGCLCDVLLKPDEKFERRWKEITNKEEL